MNKRLNIPHDRSCAVFAIGLTLIVASCSSNNPPSIGGDASVEESKATKDVITVSSKMSRALPLAEATTQRTDYHVVLSGHTDFDPNKVSRVFPLVTGVANHIFVNEGDVVRKGQVLAEVYSSDFASAVSDFQKARAHEQVTQKALARMKHLLDSKLASQSDFDQAESDESQARSDYDRSLSSLKELGGNEKSTTSVFQITAPIDGTVVERLIQQGSQVRNDGLTLAFTIGSTSSLWVMLDAYPENLRSLNVGDSVVIKAAGMEEHPFTSKIEYIASTVDPTSFTTKIRCTLPNSGGLLKPAMFVGATVYHADGQGLYIPASAAFYDADGKVYVFIQTAPHTFRKQEVGTGQTESDRVQIMSGLNMGDTIVADQALFLNDELQADQK